MNPNEEKLIKELKHHANDHTPTLVPHQWFKGKYQPTFFYVEGHADLLLTVRALIYLSMRALDPELGIDDVREKKEGVFIRQALIVANRLMPNGEEELMDYLNEYFRE